MTHPEQPADAADAVEAADVPLTQYAMYAVFRRDTRNELELSRRDIERAVESVEAVAAGNEELGVTLRGIYDVSGFRHDGEVMLWMHAERAEDLQWSLRQFRRLPLFDPLVPSWQAVGVHRAAEFNERHMPAFMLGAEPRQWVSVYPFVRSYEWYLLPDDERRAMLADHGRRGAAFSSTLANTIAAFGISDYEWLLALEDDDLINLVDMMRDLRQTDARRHVREETPFYTGRRITAAELIEVLQ